MIRRPPRSTRTDTLFPYTTLFRSVNLALSDAWSTGLLLAGQLGTDTLPLESQWVLGRSEEHTSELQSLMRISYAVFCLKKKKKRSTKQYQNNRKKIRETQQSIKHRTYKKRMNIRYTAQHQLK